MMRGEEARQPSFVFMGPLQARIPTDHPLRALLLQVLYAIPSERRLCEHLEFNLIFRWFVGLDLNDPVWHPTTFTKTASACLTARWRKPSSGR